MNGEERQLTRGELAKNGGVNIETIRYYERRGLLPKPPRSRSGYRLYSPADVWRIQFIKRVQELGFSLDEVKEFLALQVEPDTGRAHARQRAELIAAIDEKIKALRALKRSLQRPSSASTVQ